MLVAETQRMISTTVEQIWSSVLEPPLTRVEDSELDQGLSLATAFASLPGARWLRVACHAGLCVEIAERTVRGRPPALADPERVIPGELAHMIANRIGDLYGRPEGWQPTVLSRSPELVLAPLRTLCSVSFASNQRRLIVTVVGP